MPELNFLNDPNAPFDWLSDLQPLFAAQESWIDRSYHQHRTAHLLYKSDGPFAIASGAGLLTEHIRTFRMSPSIITRLGQVTDGNGRSVFQESFLNHLQRLQLRVQVNIAPEGTLLLPGEPVLTVQGTVLQILLLESAFRMLLWHSTHWTTKAAWYRWKTGDLSEEDTAPPPAFPTNPLGWKIRAAYIGGASADEILESMAQPARPLQTNEGIQVFERTTGEPLSQIRRLYKGPQFLGDLWLTPVQEESASVSKTSTRLINQATGAAVDIAMTRFQNLYQPALVKGHPVMPAQRLAYLRQRTFKQMEALKLAQTSSPVYGWLDN